MLQFEWKQIPRKKSAYSGIKISDGEKRIKVRGNNAIKENRARKKRNGGKIGRCI